MRIGINGYEAVIPRFGFDPKTGLPNRVGSAEVCFQLLLELSKIDKTNTYTIYLPTDPTADMPRETDNWRYKVIKSKRAWTILGLNKKLITEKLDVFFSPTHYSPFFLKCPQVLLLLDVSYKRFPEMFAKKDLYKLSLWGKYSVKRAARIITISHSSKDDIINVYGVKPDKISVVHLGIKTDPASEGNMDELRKQFGINGNYILFVGTLQPRKNIVRLIAAFSQIATSEKNVDLVIVGKKGWMYEDILDAPVKFRVEKRVKFLHSVSDKELPLLYKEAECFVLPSLYEGFGLPVLEAMKYGCPVIISNVSSLPEAGGDAALYVDPTSVENIAETIKNVLNDKSLRDKMVKKGYEQVKKFSWEKSAREVLQVLEEVVK